MYLEQKQYLKTLKLPYIKNILPTKQIQRTDVRIFKNCQNGPPTVDKTLLSRTPKVNTNFMAEAQLYKKYKKVYALKFSSNLTQTAESIKK